MYTTFEELMKKHNVTAYRVGKETGIASSTFTDWKNGRSVPKQDKMQRIADYFNVSIEYLMTGIDGSEKKESELTTKDERDIARKLDRLMDDIRSGEDGPMYYNGEEIDDTSLSLLENALESAMKQLKIINKQKYNPNKNKNK